ncbi:glycosyltransferase [Chryseobacterium wangxinyae]|uniref:glycosyltransferase n=1 Tax=Chryseobacterium sp. CY350 TaxID=2997336 RepID=UPI00226E8FC4|nr:glycosyltransferase [Chryseobacterium sp. CY350]MCY0978736.1 glycosyltransferase [Chryseobacterium sp. CY350]WBZ93883.1 glycosyltransferase [Chryseobacterium sp. CY350]
MSQRKIYFVCPSNATPTGGVKQIYKMVDILNKNGYDAYVLHKKDERETWFHNSTRIAPNPYIFKLKKYINSNKLSIFNKIKLAYLKKISFNIDKDSILVFPEIYNKINNIEPSVKKVIFNQNCYYTFNNYSLDTKLSDLPYNDKNIIGTITVSDDSMKYLLEAFPNSNIKRIRLGINSEIFYYSDKKKKKISFMPRKLADDINQVINIFRLRNPNSDWEFTPIDNLSEDEVAEILRKSSIFLSFNHREGFGLPPVEAMSCGCYVIGYKGQAGKEYFNPEFSSSVLEGDIIDYVKKIEDAIKTFDNNFQEMIHKGKLASDFVQLNYNSENEENDIIKIWEDFLH